MKPVREGNRRLPRGGPRPGGGVAAQRGSGARRSRSSPAGVAALGYTLQPPTEDRYLMTRAELLDRLDVLLGGRVAEEIIFGDVSTGAQNDLQRATDIARSMVTQYGMSETLGLVTFEEPREPLPHAAGAGRSREYSEKTAQAIDDEIRAMLTGATPGSAKR